MRVSQNKTVIFDIDGTLADISHRLHWVSGGNKDWVGFFAAMVRDPVVEPIRELLWKLHEDYEIVLCSGRPEEYRETTQIWLNQHHIIDVSALYMRPTGDYRPDHVIKAELLVKMREDGFDPWLAIDDRPRIVAMWREHGITCLQCRDWAEFASMEPGLLTVMVGPSGAGKSTWLKSDQARELGIKSEQIVSSDALRIEFCGDFLSQERNDEVFAALHSIVKARVSNGLSAVVDATNIRTKDRRAVAALTSGPVRYIVIDRPLNEKYRDAGWRGELKGADGKPFDLIAKHDQTFKSNLKDILDGDSLANVTVMDLRQ